MRLYWINSRTLSNKWVFFFKTEFLLHIDFNVLPRFYADCGVIYGIGSFFSSLSFNKLNEYLSRKVDKISSIIFKYTMYIWIRSYFFRKRILYTKWRLEVTLDEGMYERMRLASALNFSAIKTIADYENINLVSIYCKPSLFITS